MAANWFKGCVYALISALVFWGTNAPAQEDPKAMLVVGIPGDFPPHYRILGDNTPSGYAIDVMNAIAQRENLEVHYRIYDGWQALQNALVGGEADVIPNLGITPQRQKTFAFTKAYETFPIGLFTRASTSNVDTLGDLIGHRVGSAEYNIGVRLIGEVPGVNGVVLPTAEATFDALMLGDVEAVVLPSPIVWSIAQQKDLTGQIRSAPAPLMEIQRAIAVRKGNVALLNRLNTAIDAFIYTSEAHTIYNRWFGKPPPYWTLQRALTVGGIVVATVFVLIALGHYLTVVRLNRQLDKAHIDLSNTLERLSLAATASKLGIWDLDLKTDRLLWDERMFELYGVAENAFNNTLDDWRARVHPMDIDTAMDQVKQAIASGDSLKMEFRILRREDVRHIEALADVMRDPQGQPTRLVGINRDVTESRKMEAALRSKNDQLKRSNEELEAFAYISSHDLREPLRTLTNFSTLLKRKLAGRINDDETDYIDFIHDAGLRMNQMVLDLLNYSKVGRMEAPASPMKVKDLVDDVLMDLQLTIKEKDAKITVGDDLPVVFGHRNELERVLLNLFGNALKYGRPDTPPEVSFNCIRDGSAWRFTITDNGIGMEVDKGYEERIFGLFERLHGHGEYGGGTGIGLAVSRKIVERHGGRIWVTSAGPGQGSCFHFTLPDGNV